MTTVDPVYTPTPISQRDGSPLANSNCRCASVATGLDYQERGAKKSTGAKIRSYMDDQSGGTDSADAAQAWQRGYSETLTIRDGYTFDNALQDLGKGSGVHLDVWHASVGSQVCQSGSGQYGHTMFVLPDQHSDGLRWRVADPWCSPAAWNWVDESRLRAGAEEWGRRVYGAARAETDWPTAGPDVRLAILRRVAKVLLTLFHPGAPLPDPRDWPTPIDPETGGAQPILFTRTAALGTAGSSPEGGGDMARFVQSNGYGVGSGKRLHVADGTDWYYLDGTKGGDFSGVADLAVVGIVDGSPGDWAVLLSTGKPYDDGSARTTIAWVKGGTVTDAPPAPQPEPPPDSGDVEQAVAERDEDWREWLLAGSPGSEDPTA